MKNKKEEVNVEEKIFVEIEEKGIKRIRTHSKRNIDEWVKRYKKAGTKYKIVTEEYAKDFAKKLHEEKAKTFKRKAERGVE